MRLWFIHNIWHYTNVFWLIDWLIDYLPFRHVFWTNVQQTDRQLDLGTCESAVCILIEPQMESGVTIRIENLESNGLYIPLNIRDLQIGRLRANRIWIESKEMCGTTDSSFQSSNT